METSNQQPEKIEIGGVELSVAEAKSILDLQDVPGWLNFRKILDRRLFQSYVQNSTEPDEIRIRWRQGEQATLQSMLEVPDRIRDSLEELKELGIPEQ